MQHDFISRRITVFMFVLSFCGFMAQSGNAADNTRELSEQQADKLVEDIFARQKKLTRLRAKVKTTKTGGPFKKPRVSMALLEAEMPNSFRFLNMGKPGRPVAAPKASLTLFDGKYLWELEPEYEGEPRRAERRLLKTAANEGKNIAITSFFVGKDIQTARELREDFEIYAETENENTKDAVHHITLKPKAKGKSVELWIRPGETIPHKIRMAEKTKKILLGRKARKGGEKVTVQELMQVTTNLQGLGHLPANTFIFPLTDSMIVTDGKGNLLDHSQMRKYLDSLRLNVSNNSQNAKHESDLGPELE